LDALQSIGLAITSTEDLALTLKIILDRLVAHLEVDSAHVLLLDQAENVLSPAASTGFRATAAPDYRVPLDEELVSQAIAQPRHGNAAQISCPCALATPHSIRPIAIHRLRSAADHRARQAGGRARGVSPGCDQPGPGMVVVPRGSRGHGGDRHRRGGDARGAAARVHYTPRRHEGT